MFASTIKIGLENSCVRGVPPIFTLIFPVFSFFLIVSTRPPPGLMFTRTCVTHPSCTHDYKQRDTKQNHQREMVQETKFRGNQEQASKNPLPVE